MWNCTNTLLGNTQTVAPQGKMPPINLFPTVFGAPVCGLFPPFQSDEMQSGKKGKAIPVTGREGP
jgi:hypothetical protein